MRETKARIRDVAQVARVAARRIGYPERGTGEALRRALAFTRSLQTGRSGEFYFSRVSARPTLYSSVYACLIFQLCDALEALSEEERTNWIRYLDQFQDASDGLFYDPAIDGEPYRTGDWWGARHFALHAVSAYDALGARPPHPLKFLSPLYEEIGLRGLLAELDHSDLTLHSNDIDNKIMNLGCLLHYQAEAWSDERAASALLTLQKALAARRHHGTSLWGQFNVEDPDERSRMVQFGYHLAAVIQSNDVFDAATVVNWALATQNRWGGFGVRANSSACEDIDSIRLITRFASPGTSASAKVLHALLAAKRWTMMNQMEDGGFVFRLDTSLQYGHELLSTPANMGSLFPTWFRLLALRFVDDWLEERTTALNRSLGYYA